MQDVNLKGETALTMITKLWELIPEETRNDLIENESEIVKGITVLENALGTEETIVKVTTVEEAETETEVEPKETEGEDNVD